MSNRKPKLPTNPPPPEPDDSIVSNLMREFQFTATLFLTRLALADMPDPGKTRDRLLEAFREQCDEGKDSMVTDYNDYLGELSAEERAEAKDAMQFSRDYDVALEWVVEKLRAMLTIDEDHEKPAARHVSAAPLKHVIN